jgi:hypothetical protein
MRQAFERCFVPAPPSVSLPDAREVVMLSWRLPRWLGVQPFQRGVSDEPAGKPLPR